jgi:hypothetical protein
MKQLLLSMLILFSQLSYAMTSNLANIEQQLIDHQKNLPKGDIKQIDYIKTLIDYMYSFDQEFRKSAIHHLNDQRWRLVIQASDALHTSKMKEILKEWGWVIISKFGPEYDNKAWLLIQHADDDPFFQAGVLFLLESLINKGETDKKNYAYLYDRVAAKFHQIGMFQKYGTQVEVNSGDDIKLQPYEGNLEDIEKRRREIGLDPLKDYFNKIKKMYRP